MVKNHIPWAIKLEHFPEQAGTLTFNGYTQSVIWRYFNPEELKIVGGSTSAVNANTYYTDFKPTAKFVFPNGTKKIYRASWKIDKLKLTKPTVSGGNNQTYDGKAKSLSFYNFNSTWLTISGNSRTASGSQTVTIALKDKNNTTWADGSTADLTFTLTVNKRVLAKPTVSGGNNQTYDKNVKALCFSGFDSDWETISNNSRTASGSQTVTIALKDKNNTTWADGSTADLTFTLTVNKRVLAKPTVSGGNNQTYDKNVKALSFSGFDSDWETISNNSRTVSGSQTVTIALKDKNNTTWADGSTADLTFTLTVNKRVLTKPTISGANEFVEDGNAHSLNFSNLDTNWEIVTGNSATAVGEQTVTISLVDKNNTQWADGSTADLNFTLTVVSSEPQIYAVADCSTTAFGEPRFWDWEFKEPPDTPLSIDGFNQMEVKVLRKFSNGQFKLAVCFGWNDDSITIRKNPNDTVTYASTEDSDIPSHMKGFKYAKTYYREGKITTDGANGILFQLFAEKGDAEYRIYCSANYDA